jgi:WD40 repeat protein
MRPTSFLICTILLLQQAACLTAVAAAPDFANDVAPIFAKYCAGCHNGTDHEGALSLDTFAEVQKGGDHGAIVVPGRADASLMIRVLTGEVEPKMPPDDNPRPTDAEIELLRKWIDAGAAGPEGLERLLPVLKTPLIAAAAGVRPYLTSLALSPDGKRLALGSYRRVDLFEPASKKVLATTGELAGKVNNIAFSQDGKLFVTSSGVAGLYGVASICNATDATTVKEIKGHRDAIYDAELSPDGRLLATCSYDRLINLWEVATGKLIRSLTGHNGAVYDLAFSLDGKLLATASADETVKIWNVTTGERMDTLGQPEGEQCSVAFSPDSEWIVAGGGDDKLRMWKLLSRDKPEINPLKIARTAHNSSILKLAFSPDGSKLVTASEGRELVLWETATLTPIKRFEEQPDVATGLAFDPSGNEFYVARIDGSWQKYAIPILDSNRVVRESGAETPAASATAAIPNDAPPIATTEQEPNDLPSAANSITTNAMASGVIAAKTSESSADVDVFRFHAQKGQQLVLEIKAARDKSPLDSKLEVLDAAGKLIPRVVLQAVRSSYFTFRGHDSTDVNDFRMHGAGEMEPNEYVYANGEVMKLWLLPRGPDSGFLVYPGVGANRFTYFGSTPITHALNQPIYIVEAHRPGDEILPNGLPVYTLYYENDDDGRRMLGTDSRVAFTVPADGEYLARVSDIRGMGGDTFKYQLIVRSPQPDFTVKMDAKDLTINAGSGKEFTVTATRKDEFDGEIRISFAKLPPGFHVTKPLTIQAGQTFARGVFTADADAPPLTAENAKLATWTATAKIDGKKVKRKPKPLREFKLTERPKILIQVLPSTDAQPLVTGSAGSEKKPVEIVIAPGETIPALLKVTRNGFDGELKFGNELSGRNLPHGVYVDNIGLNGITLLTGESERTIFLTARKWVPEQTRLFHLQVDAEGKQTSWPVMLRVRKHADALAETEKSIALSRETN